MKTFSSLTTNELKYVTGGNGGNKGLVPGKPCIPQPGPANFSKMLTDFIERGKAKSEQK